MSMQRTVQLPLWVVMGGSVALSVGDPMPKTVWT